MFKLVLIWYMTEQEDLIEWKETRIILKEVLLTELTISEQTQVLSVS